MIRFNLEVADPTRSDAPKLLALAALFTQLAQGSTAEQARAQLESKAGAGLVGFRQEHTVGGQVVGGGETLASYGQTVPLGALDPADNPATGMPTPAEAFGAGNGGAASGSASSPSIASTGAALTSAQTALTTASDASSAGVALPEPAAVFAGNVAPLTPPAGTPPAQPNGVPTGGAPIPASGGVELDAEGIPWDASIHASTRARIANGTWKVKRGTGEAYLVERKAQLKAAVSVGQQAAAGNAGALATPPAGALPPPPAPVAGAPVPPPPPSSAGNVTATPPASGQTTAAAVGSSSITLAQLLPRITAAIDAGTLTADSAAAIVRELSGGQIDSVAMLAVAPALIPQFAGRLDALGIPA